MGKDPAVLFYTGDFMSGTSFMSYEQKGRYISLLCMQHQCGRIPESKIVEITNNDPMILCKFIKDESGCYYNERMEEESSKRRRHSEHQRENANKRWDKCRGNAVASAVAMPLENGNSISISSSLKSAEKLSSFMRHHTRFLTSGPDYWMNFEYQSGLEWARLYQDDPTVDVELIIDRAVGFKEYCEAKNTDADFITHPQNWIKNGGFNTDWRKLAKKTNGSGLPEEPIIYGKLVTLEDLYPNSRPIKNENHN